MEPGMANENTKRRTPKGALLGLIGLGFILAVVGLLYSPDPEMVTEPLVGMDAPDFEFELDGTKQSLSGLRGKVVLVNFWAYWCEPCRDEIVSLKKLENLMAGKEFVLLMGHVGDEKEEALKIADLPSKLIFDVPAGVLASYGVSGLPHSVLIDKQGIIRADMKGARDWISPEIVKLIQEPLG